MQRDRQMCHHYFLLVLFIGTLFTQVLSTIMQCTHINTWVCKPWWMFAFINLYTLHFTCKAPTYNCDPRCCPLTMNTLSSKISNKQSQHLWTKQKKFSKREINNLLFLVNPLAWAPWSWRCHQMPQVWAAKNHQTHDIVTQKERKANKPNFSKLLLWSKCHILHEH